MKNSHDKTKEKLNSSLPFPSFEKLNEYIVKKNELVERIKIESASHIDQFENLIFKIKDIICSYKSQINQIEENLEISIKNKKISLRSFIRI